MKIFETPELKISKFNRANIITLSGEETTSKTAIQAAQDRLAEVNPNATIFTFVADNA